jgi:hypothetical protein
MQEHTVKLRTDVWTESSCTTIQSSSFYAYTAIAVDLLVQQFRFSGGTPFYVSAVIWEHTEHLMTKFPQQYSSVFTLTWKQPS